MQETRQAIEPARIKQRILIVAAVLTALAALLFGVQDLWALEVPQLKGRVNDYANMLGATTQKQLDNLLADLERTDGTQIVVLTVPALQGDPIEDFSIRVAEQWGIGQKADDNGAILLIAKNDRKIRIEVGYGLEGRLTDLMAGRIIRDVIAPQFKMGRFDQGVLDGVAAMVGTVRGEYTAPASRRPAPGEGGPGASGLVGLIVLFFLLRVLGRVNRGVGAAVGGVLAPIAGAFFFGAGALIILALIPIGAIGGYLLGLFGAPLSFGHNVSQSRRGTYWGGGGFGGFSGGGGFGGFSGGGGGFGGGGASGGW